MVNTMRNEEDGLDLQEFYNLIWVKHIQVNGGQGKGQIRKWSTCAHM